MKKYIFALLALACSAHTAHAARFELTAGTQTKQVDAQSFTELQRHANQLIGGQARILAQGGAFINDIETMSMNDLHILASSMAGLAVDPSKYAPLTVIPATKPTTVSIPENAYRKLKDVCRILQEEAPAQEE